MHVQDFYYNGVKTRMYLKYSDIDHEGELSLIPSPCLSQQQKIDTLLLWERAKAKIEAWEKAKGKKYAGVHRTVEGTPWLTGGGCGC